MLAQHVVGCHEADHDQEKRPGDAEASREPVEDKRGGEERAKRELHDEGRDEAQVAEKRGSLEDATCGVMVVDDHDHRRAQERVDSQDRKRCREVDGAKRDNVDHNTNQKHGGNKLPLVRGIDALERVETEDGFERLEHRSCSIIQQKAMRMMLSWACEFTEWLL